MSQVAAALPMIDLNAGHVRHNLSTPVLIEEAIERGEGKLAANGTLLVSTGERTGRSPSDKYLEDTPDIHDKIWWGKVNQPITPDGFDYLLTVAQDYYKDLDEVFVFDGFVGADPRYRLASRTYTELAWHALFVKTLFIEPDAAELAGFDPDWTIINCSRHHLTKEQSEKAGITPTGICVAQSLTRKTVLIFGTEYAGEMKKSLFYAMNFDMPEAPAGAVLPMHCSSNVDENDPSNVALFFGLSGTGKTTLSADPHRALIGDDEHGWSADGIFNFEGGCYAKCIKLSEEGEPQIWDAIRFGSVLENVVIDPDTRVSPTTTTAPSPRTPGSHTPSNSSPAPPSPPSADTRTQCRLPHRGRLRRPAPCRQTLTRAGDVLLHQRIHIQTRRHRRRRHRAPAQLLPVLRRPVPPAPPARIRRDARRADLQTRRICLARQHRMVGRLLRCRQTHEPQAHQSNDYRSARRLARESRIRNRAFLRPLRTQVGPRFRCPRRHPQPAQHMAGQSRLRREGQRPRPAIPCERQNVRDARPRPSRRPHRLLIRGSEPRCGKSTPKGIRTPVTRMKTWRPNLTRRWGRLAGADCNDRAEISHPHPLSPSEKHKSDRRIQPMTLI